MSNKVDFFRHDLGEAELSMIREVLQTPMLTTGKVTREFEDRFAAYLGVEHAIGCMSATAALQLAYLALDIGEGDEVITTPMSFIATSNAILHVGATPVFVDVEADTGNIDPAAIEAAITDRTRAIAPVHLYGQLCDMREIARIATKHGLAIIEDCAHSLEASQDGYRSGNLGTIGAFSFYPTKSMTCGEGGCITTHDADLASKLQQLTLHGMTKGAGDRYGSKYEHWDMDLLGYKANLSNLLAAMLLPQLDRIDANRQRREEISRRYEQAFVSLDGVDFPRVRSGRTSARHLFSIWVDASQRDNYLAALQEEGIGVAVNYRAIHLMRYYKERFGYKAGMFPEAERIGASTITLPLFALLPDPQVDQVIDAVSRVAKRLQ
ncbi:MAG: DegT/DnrJ/EryC1/StrS family aminotransferase [Deltaproteobacteria bacterium]|nr:DegT/DnrJ/EryC1/StrS family aminotransferase [Deltaproteobacteria bacterium]